MTLRRVLTGALLAAVATGCTPAPQTPPVKAPPVKAPPPSTTTTLPASNKAPTLSALDVSATTGLAPMTVTATATATDPEGDAIHFGWQALGGGQVTATAGNTATFVFDKPGHYTVMVSAADRCPGGVFDAMGCLGQSPLPKSVDVHVTGWDLEVLGQREAAIAADIVAYHNEERAARGLPTLTVDPSLADDDALEWLTEYVTTYDPVTHETIGHDPDFIGRENLRASTTWSAYTVPVGGGTPTETSAGFASHIEWMRSAGHRKTLLDPRWDKVGVVAFCDPATGRFGAIVRFSGNEPGYAAPPDDVEHATPPAPGTGATCARG